MTQEEALATMTGFEPAKMVAAIVERRRRARERAREIRERRERGIERKPGRTATSERALDRCK